jgi:murein DD-endopeptidase MepM/ murein hydrolase activator NlpD
MRRLAPVLALAALALPQTALGADGGASTPDNGGAAFGQHDARRAPARRSRSRPLLAAFEAAPERFYAYGRPARIDFRIEGRARTVRVWLTAMRAGGRKALRRIELGDRRTGVDHSFRLDGVDGGALPEGELDLRLGARDPRGRTLRAGARASAVKRLSFYWHRLPVAGPFSYGGPDAMFGAARPGHTHQGQDLTAPEGTPVVAPRGGTVQAVAYQAEGAGQYVILDGEGEDRDYAFMHLQAGSIRVQQGQVVGTGAVLGLVGSTGASSGPHLHFEVWEGGGWYEGGHPVDPLPYLRRWDAWS